jgi:peptidoglycan/xylan/chitin deacetylase (PgdA/CDA1 family)
MSALPILGYHNVAMASEDAPFKLLCVSPDSFERQLWTLQRLGLRGVSTSEGIVRLNNGTSSGCVVFTFDDGYADTLTVAAPLMKRYGFRATCYVVSGAVGTYNSWDAEFLRERKPLMSRDQLDQWLAAGMEVGSHSLSHQRLHELPQDVARPVFCRPCRAGAARRLLLRDDGRAGSSAGVGRPSAAAADSCERRVGAVEVPAACRNSLRTPTLAPARTLTRLHDSPSYSDVLSE